MSRVARVVAIGYAYHITQRGNNRQKVFLDDRDQNKYLSFIKKYSREYKLSILSYCLMPNHVHFIVIPNEEYSLAKTYNFTHMRYSQYFNKKAGGCGHLWQGRFYSCILDEAHLIAAARYIECNPVRAKLVKEPWRWKWSSACYNIGEERSNLIINSSLFKYIDVPQDMWKDYLKMKDDKKIIEEFKKHTRTGLPLGTEQFVKHLEKKIGRVLCTVPRGRPWKKNK